MIGTVFCGAIGAFGLARAVPRLGMGPWGDAAIGGAGGLLAAQILALVFPDMVGSGLPDRPVHLAALGVAALGGVVLLAVTALLRDTLRR